MNDLISMLSEIRSNYNCFDENEEPYYRALSMAIQFISNQPDLCKYSSTLWKTAYERGKKDATLCGYKIEHLDIIAKLLEMENLPPERVSDALHDIYRVVDIVVKEFEETLRKVVTNNESKG